MRRRIAAPLSPKPAAPLSPKRAAQTKPIINSYTDEDDSHRSKVNANDKKDLMVAMEVFGDKAVGQAINKSPSVKDKGRYI